MKKQYAKPIVEKIEFDYSSIVTASNNASGCHVGGSTYDNANADSCSLVETWVGANG